MLRVLLARSLVQLCGSARVAVEERSRQPLLTNLAIVTLGVKTESSNEETPVSHQNLKWILQTTLQMKHFAVQL